MNNYCERCHSDKGLETFTLKLCKVLNADVINEKETVVGGNLITAETIVNELEVSYQLQPVTSITRKLCRHCIQELDKAKENNFSLLLLVPAFSFLVLLVLWVGNFFFSYGELGEQGSWGFWGFLGLFILGSSVVGVISGIGEDALTGTSPQWEFLGKKLGSAVRQQHGSDPFYNQAQHGKGAYPVDGYVLFSGKEWGKIVNPGSAFYTEPIAREGGAKCPYCDSLLRTDSAKQCASCLMDWHDPDNPRKMGQG